MDIDFGEYVFRALANNCMDVRATRDQFPSIYPKETPATGHGAVTDIVLQCTKIRRAGETPRVECLSMETVKREKFALDVGYTHVVEAIGKPKDSSQHFCITTKEPYGVVCLQGLKVSHGMHSFGEKRFGSGLLDDVRSVNDQNTRIIGDFTKMVRVTEFIRAMYEAVRMDHNWALQFHHIVLNSKFAMLNEWDPIMPKIIRGCRILATEAPNWRRQTVQTRFFETGDNFYLGMEFCREYDAWKEELGDQLVANLRARDRNGRQQVDISRLRGLLLHYIDRLWYEGVLETIRKGDVYNPGARHRVPRLYLIDSHIPQELKTRPPMEAFRLVEDRQELYEILYSKRKKIYCRTVEGCIKVFTGNEMVKRESNLTRGPDGNVESKVALATFPVGHYVNHRTMIKFKNGYVFAFAGDEQATPHFMRYSGLTGACINAMSFNVFIGKAALGVDFQTRYREYSNETSWSNGEVVQRGTGANYGQDGFLRPGFPYQNGVNYLYDRLVEFEETGQTMEDALSFDWKVKFAAALIPRGLEFNEPFLKSLKREWSDVVLTRFIEDLGKDPLVDEGAINDILHLNKFGLDREEFWKVVEQDIRHPRCFLACCSFKTLLQCIEVAQALQSKDLRVSSALFHQHKPVDSIVDDFAVEAQSVANSLTQSAAFAAGALAFRLVGTEPANIASAVLAGVNILISFGTMANISRYKIRNEEARIEFFYHCLPRVEKSVFSLMGEEAQLGTDLTLNPYHTEIVKTVEIIRNQLKYYDIENKEVFDHAYEQLKKSRFERNAVRRFQGVLLTEFLPSKFYENSYIQESLVGLYRITLEILEFEPQGSHGTKEAEQLFEKLQQFKPRLKSSLQEGPIRWGFLKQRKFSHWDLCAGLSYLRSLFYWRHPVNPFCGAPVEIENQRLAGRLRDLSILNGGTILSREQLDVERCYWAHRESQVASAVFLMAFLVFLASTIFTLARIFGINQLENAAFWAAGPSTLGAVLAAFHLLRKERILVGLLRKVSQKKSMARNSDSMADYAIVIGATRHQIALTASRLVTAATAAVVLPFALAISVFETDSNMMKDDSAEIPSLLAAISVLAGIVSLVYFFVVEYVVRYNLPLHLGPFICRIFLDEIMEINRKMKASPNGIDSPKMEDRTLWEYTARQFLHTYRFDTVFAADRFGQILLTIQGGLMDTKTAGHTSESESGEEKSVSSRATQGGGPVDTKAVDHTYISEPGEQETFTFSV